MTHRFAVASRAASWLLAAMLPLSLALGNIAAATTMALALPVAALRRPFPRHLLWPAIGFALLWGSHLLSSALSPTPNWSKLYEEFWIKLLLFLLPCVMTRASRERALLIFLVVGVAVAAFAATQHFHGIDPWRGGTVNRFGERYQSVGFFGHHLSYGGHLLVVASAMLARLVRSTRHRMWLVAGLAICLLAMQWSVARSAQLGLLAAIVAVALRGGRRARWVAVGSLLVIVATVALTPKLHERWTKLSGPGGENTRVLLWKSSVDAIRAQPMGFGPGNFKSMMEEYGHEGHYESKAHAHNDLLMYGVVAGVPGMLGYLLFWGACGLVLWRRSRDGNDAALAAFACVVGFAVASLFQVYQTDDEVELSLYFLMGLGMSDDREGE